jgi:DNA primase
MRSADPKKKGYIDFFLRKDESVLFGLSQAMEHAWSVGELCIVEGAFDLFPIQRHTPGVVSTLHAGLSADFVRVLRRLVSRLVIIYDNDFAGRDTSYKIKKALGSEMAVDVVHVPKTPLKLGGIAKDPCDLWSIGGDSEIGVLLQPHSLSER